MSWRSGTENESGDSFVENRTVLFPKAKGAADSSGTLFDSSSFGSSSGAIQDILFTLGALGTVNLGTPGDPGKWISDMTFPAAGGLTKHWSDDPALCPQSGAASDIVISVSDAAWSAAAVISY